MTNPDPPTDLSADAINSTTAKLVWSAPVNTGGVPIMNYDVFRGIDGVTPTFLAVTLTSDAKYEDSSLTARQKAEYQVRARNTDSDVSTLSTSASTTTATSEAQTIAELLFDNWFVTGELSKNVIAGPPEMTEPVHFFDRGQVPGNKFAKAVTVQKVNEIGNEHIIEHPKFFEQSDTFEITCFLQVIDSADDQFSVWIDLMQQMTSKVTSILQTKFAPSAGTGIFFTTNLDWTRDDTFFTDDPQLTRTLRFTLTRILSNDETVYIGYPIGSTAREGVLVFDVSASQGDTKPASDYSYLQVTQIQLDEGWTQIPILTKDTTKGIGVPQIVRGVFSGVFSALMFAKKGDIIGSTIDKIQNIYEPQAKKTIFHQTAEVVLLQKTSDTQTMPSILTVTSTMKIDRITKIFEDNDLLKFRVRGTLTKQSGFGAT